MWRHYPDDSKKNRTTGTTSIGLVDKIEFYRAGPDRIGTIVKKFKKIMRKQSQTTETIEGYLRNHHSYSSNRRKIWPGRR